ncbi:MAG: transporter substrate-binding domain-containing protein [Cupriavidus necator]
MRDASGRWAGIDADFCRAVAAAALGDASKVAFVPLRASARFPALHEGMIDLLARNTTWTLAHERVRYQIFGNELTLVALALITGVALLSSVLANVPVAAASIVMVKGYLVMAEVVPEAALATHFSQWPAASVPVFIGMMFGATLGGNATLVGASANIVAAGICARQGTPVSFATFLRYGLPITVAQLVAAAAYILVLSSLLG